jgi:hypothetical protein
VNRRQRLHAAHRLRVYFQGLQALPGPFQPCEFDAHGLPVLAVEVVGDRAVSFSRVPGQPRLRLTFPGADPPLLGHVTGLDTFDPRLHLAEPLHVEWGLDHADELTEEAGRIWTNGQTDCGG